MIESEQKYLWEILVPTIRRIDGKPYTTRFHRTWDVRVRSIAGGLTIMVPSKGQWIAPDGELFTERMIPVRISCTRTQIKEIIKMTINHYDQLAIMAYRVSDEVYLVYKDE